ncbi:hypothetical protein J3E72DRAFT_265599 [Bipolaris maydis]|nr:hypothetical protein J3E72DRAFT_265599 [Bipolaris maydis]
MAKIARKTGSQGLNIRKAYSLPKTMSSGFQELFLNEKWERSSQKMPDQFFTIQWENSNEAILCEASPTVLDSHFPYVTQDSKKEDASCSGLQAQEQDIFTGQNTLEYIKHWLGHILELGILMVMLMCLWEALTWGSEG